MRNGHQTEKDGAIYVMLLTAVTLGVCWIGYLLRRRGRSEPTATSPLSERIQVVCEPQRQRNRVVDWITLAGNLATVFVALVAVAALRADIQEVDQMRAEIAEMQQYNRLSAVPRLEFYRVRDPTSPYPSAGLYLMNMGPGLALLKNYFVYVDDKSVDEGWDAAIQLLELSDLPGFRRATIPPTLPAGFEFKIMLVGFETDNFTVEHKNRWENALSRFSLEIHYESVYGEKYVQVQQKLGQDE